MSDGISFLGAEELARLDELLNTFLTETDAACALLLDRAGRLLTARGDTGGMDGVTFASLAAADFAASDQLAVLLGEREFSSLYHHGDRRSMFLADIGGRVIFATLFDTRTPLGIVRLRTRSLVPQIGAVIADMERDGPRGDVVRMDTAWAEEVGDEIDRLFAD